MRKNVLLTMAALIFGTSLAYAQLGTTAPTNTLSVAVSNEAALTISGSGTTTLASTGTNFANYTGTTSMIYFIRTTETSGSGYIKAQITTDFAPAGGPSVANSGTSGDTLSYACTVAAPGTACTGSVNASTTAQTSIATFAAGVHSAKAGNAASLLWTLINDPAYKTATYSATVTFTISAT
ncbi:MAG: hypothetical protein P4N24_17725 [Acidobacteriota bacterium]|nr:hypothetical protein [Acidobacteriota bacterium]